MTAVRRARSRTVRGFTLLEFIVTVVLTAAVFSLLLPWVMNLVTVSSANLDTAAGDRQARAVTATLSADLADAVMCPGTGTPVRSSSPTTFSVFTGDIRPGGTVALVTWRLIDGRLERSATPAEVTSDQCGPADPATDPALDPQTLVWATFSIRAQVSPPTRTDSVALFTEQAPDGARVITADLSLGSADTTSAPAPVRVAMPIFTSYQGLS